MSGVAVPWWIAGGWALDLYLRRQTRPHADLDVGIFRRDVQQVLRSLSDWEFVESQGGATRALGPDKIPRTSVNCLWGRPAAKQQWLLELMLDDSSGDDWVYRRDVRIRRSRGLVLRQNLQGIPYLAPEVQLLFKSKQPRDKDHTDFGQVLPALNPAARDWLHGALAMQDPSHAWLTALAGNPIRAR